MKTEYLVKKLDLLPHPEGGYYREVYRSDGFIPEQLLNAQFIGDRNYCTSIYFLIEKNNFSAFHKIKSDEIWHFYDGDALEVLEIDERGKLKSTWVGRNLEIGEVFQYTVKANTWFGSRVRVGGEFSLVGCTVAPGFDFKDFELAQRENLINEFPLLSDVIIEMTRV